MMQALFNGFSFDPFALFDDGFSPTEVSVGRRDVFQALVIALVIIMFDEHLDLPSDLRTGVSFRRTRF